MQAKKGKNFWLSILIAVNGVLYYTTRVNAALFLERHVSQVCTVSNIEFLQTGFKNNLKCNKYQNENHNEMITPKNNRVTRSPYSPKIFSRENFSSKPSILRKPNILDSSLEHTELLKSKYQIITASLIDTNPQLIASRIKYTGNTTKIIPDNCINADIRGLDIKNQARKTENINTSGFCTIQMDPTILSSSKVQNKSQSTGSNSPSFYLLSQTSEPPTQNPTDSPIQSEENPTSAQENPQPIDPPPVEGEPANINNNPSPTEIENKLNTTESGTKKKFERLLQRLEENKQPIVNPRSEKDTQPSANIGDSELGLFRVLERPLEQLPIPRQPVAKFKPIGSLIARVGYFQTSNIFSAQIDPQADGLFYSGLTISSVPLRLGGQTYLRGSIDGNIFRYLEQSDFNYNQLRFNLGIFQRLSSKMYAELGWRNQQLFYARDSDRFNIASGDKFLNENAFRLSLGRRDPLGKKLTLDSFYELRLSLTDIPSKRDRIINYLSVFLNYYLQKPLQVGFGYQFNYSDFTERIREDQYHRLLANLNYKISDYSNLSLQTGISLGSSTQENIDFDGWFFSINYNFDLGKF